MSTIGYNERAWAIDLISTVNECIRGRASHIVRAGGEYTVRGQGPRLFPDVLLFGDITGTMPIQGWELKMPDTSISDVALLENAATKARRLGLDSFVVWNGDRAALYRKAQGVDFTLAREWPATGLTTRDAVRTGRVQWMGLLQHMLDDLEVLFANGQAQGTRVPVVLGTNLFIDFLERRTGSVSQHLEATTRRDAVVAARIDRWWRERSPELGKATSKYELLAKTVILGWLNRILFAHCLRRYHRAASAIDELVIGLTPAQGRDLFERISATCDFAPVFGDALGLEHVDPATWQELIEVHLFLATVSLDQLDQATLREVLQAAAVPAQRKLAGQFATPMPLASLLVRLAIRDRTAHVLDPCCGTGTVARAALELKRSVGIAPPNALATTWASDKFEFPLQAAVMALTDPAGADQTVRVFRQDAFELVPRITVQLRNPATGLPAPAALPPLHALISNLPFVRFEDQAAVNPRAAEVRDQLADPLDARSDLYATLLQHLYPLLGHDGRVGVIVSNAWLGADWGRAFRAALLRRYRVLFVVASAAGRWFANADVVTNLLVLERRADAEHPADTEVTVFATTHQPLSSWSGLPDGIAGMADALLLGAEGQGCSMQRATLCELLRWEAVGLGWNSFFADVAWVDQLANCAVQVASQFDIARGERRGWNDLFYPEPGHGIEPEFLQPVLKTSSTVSGLQAKPDGVAFCCSRSLTELRAARKTGALRWIERFERARNGRGELLPQVLTRPPLHWYELRPDTLADLVVSMNPDERLWVPRFARRSFVDQRLIRLTATTETDVDLCHALLNSVVSLFLLEAAGFGRGLGALDLNATKLRSNWRMLDPGRVLPEARSQILQTFAVLKARPVRDVLTELAAPDRVAFDEAVLRAYGLDPLRPRMARALATLYRMRQAVKDDH